MARQSKLINFPRPSELTSITIAKEYDKKNIGMTMPDREVVYKSSKDLEEQITKRVRLYHQQFYEAAYLWLSEAALWGLRLLRGWCFTLNL